MYRLYAIGLLAFLAAGGISLPPQASAGQAGSPIAGPIQGEGSEVFKCTIVGNGVFKKSHRYFGFRVYEGSHGTTLRTTYGGLPSPKQARAELKEWAKGAKRVIEKGPTRDASGHSIGQRVVAIFANSHGEWTRVAWTKNSDLFIVDSVSARAALYFEERFNDDGIAMTEEVPSN